MIYDCDNAIVKIVGVENVKWNKGIFNVSPREYSALAFRIKGTATITVGNDSYFVNENDILYLPQNIAYTAEYTDTEMLVIHFQTEVSDVAPQVFSISNEQKIYKSFLTAHTIWQNKAPGYEAFVLSKLYDILGVLCEIQTKVNLPDYFLKAVSYINTSFKSSSINIEDICKRTGISATYLRVLFKKYYQKSPMEYITNLRLENARNLISCGFSVENAALESGFNDSKYFARVVKKYFGCTPRELRIYGK